jgi:outer membrane protein assembly factor BamB
MLGNAVTMSTVAASSVTDWPMLSHDPHHSGYVASPTPNSTTASTLGLNWMANLNAADLGSPVVAFNTTLSKTVIYVGDENGDVFAFDESNGQQIWGVNLGLGNSIRATPAVATDGSVWVATTYGTSVTKLDGATGATLCSASVPTTIDASVTIAQPPNGVLTVYIGTNDGNVTNGEELALRESNCQTIFTYKTFRTTHAGTWTTSAFSYLPGRKTAAILFGTSDPDSTEYAIDAHTGQALWNYAMDNPAPYVYDVGEAASISAPGVNDFADGVAYVSSKYANMRALDLVTGATLWQFDMYPSGYTGLRDARSGPALVNNNVTHVIVFGYLGGVYALNAITGAMVWQYVSPEGLEVISSPAVVGPTGQEVVAFSDVAGKLHVLRLADGVELYSYQTGGYVTASVAVSNGHLITVSTDGFLYDFTAGGGNAAPPSTQIAFPAQAAQVANPNGNLTVTGGASDAQGVTQVHVAVAYLGPTGIQWYNAANNTTNDTAAVSNPATLTSPGATSTTWSFPFPVPASGGAFEVFANAVNAAQQADIKGAHSTFSVLPSPTAPQITLSSQYVSPGGVFMVTGSGFQGGEKVSFSVDGNVLASGTAKSSGAVPATKITLPGSGNYGNKSRFGPTTLVAVGQTSQKTTSAFLDITNQWTQAAAGSTRTAFEANDQKLHELLHIAEKQFVQEAWYTPTGAAIQSSPAIVNGVAYVGNDAGVLSAINVTTAAPLWTYTIASNAAIRGGPAVDGSLAIFGAVDGTLYEVNTTTGQLFGSLPIGGNLTSPAASGGVAYIASDSGSVTAVVESHNGSPVMMWTASVGNPIHSSVAFDPATTGSPVVVGDDSGTITAIDGTTGQTLWTAKTDGAVTGTPSIRAGVVYVGSSDGNIYAFNETTGAAVWQFNVGSAITAGGVAGGVVGPTSSVIYGTANGRLIALTDAGKQQWSVHLGQPIVGVAAAYDAVISETANGMIFGNRGTQAGLKIWSFQTGAALNSVPAIVDGAVYVGAEDTGLYAFTPYGRY